MLLPGGVVQALEQLIKSLDEHHDPGSRAAAEDALTQPRGRRGPNTVTNGSGTRRPSQRQPSFFN